MRERSRPLICLLELISAETVFSARLTHVGDLEMPDRETRASAAAPPLSQPAERWLARWLKHYPLLALPLIWVAGVCTYDFFLSLALRVVTGPLPSLGFFYVFIPLVFSLATAGLLLSFGAWTTAIRRGRKIILIVELTIECIGLPVLHFAALFYLFFALCAADHSCP